jgi:hypothetical protein
MSLFMANPGLVTGLAVASLLIIAILYWIKPPPPTVIVSSSILWTRLMRERKRSSILDKLRRLLSILIACIIAVFIVAALGGPELISSEESEIKNATIVMDNSGTMATLTRDGSTRWEHAVEVAKEILMGSHPSAEFLILDTSGQIVSRVANTKWKALEELEKLSISFGGNVQYPVLMSRDARLVFISDGVSPIAVPTMTETISVFEPAENVGITSLTVSSGLSESASAPRGFVQVTNGSLNVKEVVIGVSGLGGKNTRESLTLKPDSSVTSVIDLAEFQDGPLRVSVTSVRDAFPKDDLAYMVKPLSSKSKVTLVTSGNVYLESALEAMSNVEFSVIETEFYDPMDLTDIYIFDRFKPEIPPSVPTLEFLIAEQSSQDIVSVGSFRSLGDHPVLRGVTLSDLRIEKVSSPSFITDDSEILWGDIETPLLIAKILDKKSVQVGFSLEGSNFPLQPAFPIFLANTIDWMLESNVPALVKQGRVVIPTDNALILDLDGNSIEANVFDGHTIFHAIAPNLYSIRQGSDRSWMPANLTNYNYTLVNKSRLNSGAFSGAGIKSDDRLNEQIKPNLWNLLVSISLLLVALEWFTYHRRITV